MRHDGCPKLLCAAMMDIQKSYLGDGSDPIKQRRENAKRKSKKKSNQTMKHCCNNCVILEWKTLLSINGVFCNNAGPSEMEVAPPEAISRMGGSI